ncbi:MAG: ORF6N domain-containing protein [Ruminococcus sp.]|nr:ORF6N domain-containing protein [Ruminococcus sp.]
MYELINGIPMPIREYHGQRVVTFKDIDGVHHRPDGTAKRNFNVNRKHFIAGVDFFKVKCSEVSTFFVPTPNGYNPNADIILVTLNGYLMISKSFTDELSWSIQRLLVNSYFIVREQVNNYSALLQYVQNLESRIEKFENVKQLPMQDIKNPVHAFIKECCVMRASYRDGITTPKLYKAFEMWCRQNTTSYAPSKSEFIAGMLSYFNTDNKKRIRKKYHGYGYYIITLNPLNIEKLL